MEKASTLSPAKQALLEQRWKRASHGPVRRAEIPRRTNRGSAPLSFAQRQMWVIDQITPGNPAYNMPNGVSLRGPLDPQALENSFNKIIQRHEALRTTFAVEEHENRLQALASEESFKSFDLSRLPLIRVSLFKLGEAEHVLLINLHHIVADGLSVRLLFDELDMFYRA